MSCTTLTFLINDSRHAPDFWSRILKELPVKLHEENNKMKSRRSFLKNALIAGAAAGIFSPFRNSKKNNSEKIKLLTPDGKLVEIEKSAIKKEIVSTRATDNEVLEWMNSKNKKS